MAVLTVLMVLTLALLQLPMTLSAAPKWTALPNHTPDSGIAGHFVLHAVQTAAGLPSATDTIGLPTMTKLCGIMKAADLYMCHCHWRSGAAGARIADSRSDAQVEDAINALPAVRTIVGPSLRLRLGRNAFLEPLDKPVVVDYLAPRAPRALLQRAGPDRAGPTPTPRPSVASRRYVQRNASASLASLSRFSTPVPSAGPQFDYDLTGENVTIYVVDQNALITAEFCATSVSTKPAARGSKGAGTPPWGSKGAGTPPCRISTDGFVAETIRENDLMDAPCSTAHGTAVSQAAAGTLSGAAKGAKVVAVGVFAGCDFPSFASELVSGLDWIMEHHDAHPGRAVVSISGSLIATEPVSSVLKSVVRELLAKGVVVVASAGDSAGDACDYVPANMPEVLTVAAARVSSDAATLLENEKANKGSCVAIWGPDVVQTYASSAVATAYVAGVAAQIMQTMSDPAAVKAALLEGAVRGVLPSGGFAQVPGSVAKT